MVTLTTTTVILVFLGVGWGLQLGPVRLVDNKRYISYNLGPSSNNSLLECPYELDEAKNEEIQKISWSLSGRYGKEEVEGFYEWSSSDGGKATGALEGAVNLHRQDGNLELTELRYNLGGFYNCSATLTNGEAQSTARWEALVIETSPNVISINTEIKDCATINTIKANAVYPEPTVHGGLYSPSLSGYYNEITSDQWLKVVYQNLSVAYSVNKREFKIDEDTPYDVYFLFTLGVTKTNGDYISLFSTTGTDLMMSSRGCPALTRKEYQKETYSTDGTKNCRNEYIKSFDNPKVTVTCQEGYHSDGELSSLELTCDLETFTWKDEDGKESNYDLRCVLDSNHDHGNDGGSITVTTSTTLLVMATTLLLCLLQL